MKEKMINKCIRIPQQLHAQLEAQNINFSKTTRKALQKYLNELQGNDQEKIQNEIRQQEQNISQAKSIIAGLKTRLEELQNKEEQQLKERRQREKIDLSPEAIKERVALWR